MDQIVKQKTSPTPTLAFTPSALLAVSAASTPSPVKYEIEGYLTNRKLNAGVIMVLVYSYSSDGSSHVSNQVMMN